VTYGACFSFDRYKPGKEVNGMPMTYRALFFGFDAFAKYHINEHVPMSRQYDPYVLLGAGYTLRFVAPNFTAFTLNVGPGLNYWFNNHWGMNVQTLGQFGLKKKFPRSSSNYLHHSIGVVYIIDRTSGHKRSFVKPRYKWIHDNRGKSGGRELKRRY
jgi:OOP family OmpA-OmpF porin